MSQESHQIITANALINGDVIYFTAQGEWSPDIQDAEVFDDPAIAQDVLSTASAHHSQAVGVYLTSVALDKGVIRTTHFREEFRKTGPSNYFHGKQETQNHV